MKMEYPIHVRISNRHVHLTDEVYHKLFKKPLTKKADLNQVGEFASNQTLTIKTGDKEISNVRVVGPLRHYHQIEISRRDARFLGVNPPVRRSGDLEDSLEITLKPALREVTTKGLILANRHVHMTPKEAEYYHVKDKDMVEVKIPGAKSGIMDAEVKVSDNGYFELHIDTDDANAFLINDNDIGTLIIK